MASKRETIMQAVLQRLEAADLAGVRVLRHAGLPEDIPAAGLVVLRDGKAGEPEILLGDPRVYLWERTAEIVVVFNGHDEAMLKSGSDGLIAAISAALNLDGVSGDPTFAGLCEHAELGEPDFDDVAPEGAAPIRGAMLPLTLSYHTSTPNGG